MELSFEHHKTLARSLKGVQSVRSIGEVIDQKETGQTLVDMMNLDMIIGSGGVLSHAPRRIESAYMMLDAYQPEGVTVLAVDSIFMMPQLGVLSVVHPEAAAQVFERDCLIRLGTCIAPVGHGRDGEVCGTISFNGTEYKMIYGTIQTIPLSENEIATVTVRPSRKFDVGRGKGREISVPMQGGVDGLIIDCRGRPLILPSNHKQRIAKLKEWHKALGLEVE